jgi:outer membrane protein assembly factor BamB
MYKRDPLRPARRAIAAAWLFLLTAGCLLPASLALADWPLVRGDQKASGVATCTLPARPRVIWEYKLPDGGFEATAVIASSVVYLGDVDGGFHAIDLVKGQPIWTCKFDDCGFLAAATLHGGRIYVGDYNGLVRALEASSGKLLWQYDTESEIHAAVNMIGADSESSDGGAVRLLVTTEGGELISLDADTGKKVWEFRIEAPLRCWPLVAGGRVFLAGCDERLHAVDVMSGKEIAGVDIDGPTGSTPALLGDRIFFGTESGSFYAIDISSMEPDWQHPAVESSSTQSRFAIRSAAAACQRAVIYGDQGKQVHALNPTNGEPLWHIRARSRVESSPVIVGDRVYVATSRGRIFSLAVDSGDAGWHFDAGGRFSASPAVADGKLVIGNEDGTLYCFGAP